VTRDAGRWNVAGSPTLYLAGTADVALAECARHLDAARSAERILYRATVRVDRVADLRDRNARVRLGGPADVREILKEGCARDLGESVRRMSHYAAIWVPSVAFLDDLGRGNLVVFADHLADGPAGCITALDAIGSVTLSGGTGSLDGGGSGSCDMRATADRPG